ncbi:MAG: hypothetical protein HOY69_37085 [Streptomyces sp.]|nr:hypothetical protein [Streptomyces sp.]
MTGMDQQTVRALAHEAFGEWTMVRADAGWAKGAVPHEPTRRFLVEVGLPVQTTLFDIDEAFHTSPLTLPLVAAQRSTWWDEETVAQHSDGIALGREPNGGYFVLDPTSGRVDLVGDNGTAGFQSSDVAVFVYLLAYFETHRTLDGVPLDDVEPFEAAAEAAYEMLRHFSQVDPRAFEGVEAPPWDEAEGGELDLGHAWEWMADGFADGLYGDWTWSSEALDYFAAKGIDPSARKPLRVPAR